MRSNLFFFSLILLALTTTNGQEERGTTQSSKSAGLLRRRLDDERFYAKDGSVSITSETAQVQSNTADGVNRRKFVSYNASKWELLWTSNIKSWDEERKICSVLLKDHHKYMFDYLKALCNSHLFGPYQNWCVIHDGNDEVPLWFNTANKQRLELTFERPVPVIVDVPPPQPIMIDEEYEHIFSKFTFLDESTGESYVEYIEPLVGFLRFPLHKCAHPVPVLPRFKNHYATFRGFIVPPPPVVRGEHALYFDTASTRWQSRLTAPDPKFFVDTWRRQGVEFDQEFIFGSAFTPEQFYNDVPQNMIEATQYIMTNSLAQRPVDHTEATPFLGNFINDHSDTNDYIVLKISLDMSGRFEIVKYLTSKENRVNELLFEHRWSEHSVFLSDYSRRRLDTDLTLWQSYELYTILRENGIRAHSWL